MISCFYDADLLEKKYGAEFLDELDLLSFIFSWSLVRVNYSSSQRPCSFMS